MRRFYCFLLLAAFVAMLGCDESTTTLGIEPGGDPAGAWDTLALTQMGTYMYPQILSYAPRQVVGHNDTLGLHAEMIMKFDYTPLESWNASRQVDSLITYISLKVIGDSSAIRITQMSNDSGYVDLTLCLLQQIDEALDVDGFPDPDSIRWNNFHSAEGLYTTVLDSVNVRVYQRDSTSDEGDPLTGIRTIRPIPSWWFNSADTTSRLLLLKPAENNSGMLSFYANGASSKIRPNLRWRWWTADTVDTENPLVSYVDSVVCDWQSGIAMEVGEPDGYWLSSGPGQHLVMEFDPWNTLLDEEGEPIDYLLGNISDAWVTLHLKERIYNTGQGAINAYYIGDYREGSELDPDWWVATDYDSLLNNDDEPIETLCFNIVSLLRDIWLEEDSFTTTDPIALGVRYDRYYEQSVRKLRVWGPDAPDSLRPSLSIKTNSAPWERP